MLTVFTILLKCIRSVIISYQQIVVEKDLNHQMHRNKNTFNDILLLPLLSTDQIVLEVTER